MPNRQAMNRSDSTLESYKFINGSGNDTDPPLDIDMMKLRDLVSFPSMVNILKNWESKSLDVSVGSRYGSSHEATYIRPLWHLIRRLANTHEEF